MPAGIALAGISSYSTQSSKLRSLPGGGVSGRFLASSISYSKAALCSLAFCAAASAAYQESFASCTWPETPSARASASYCFYVIEANFSRMISNCEIMSVNSSISACVSAFRGSILPIAVESSLSLAATAAS